MQQKDIGRSFSKRFNGSWRAERVEGQNVLVTKLDFMQRWSQTQRAVVTPRDSGAIDMGLPLKRNVRFVRSKIAKRITVPHTWNMGDTMKLLSEYSKQQVNKTTPNIAQ